MTSADALSIARESIYVALKLGAPAMLLALAVGLAISFFQALTQIQEMTLTFVPKILVMFVSLIVLMPFMMTTLQEFMTRIADMIVAIP